MKSRIVLCIFMVVCSIRMFAQQTLKNGSPGKYFANALELFQNKQYAAAEQLFDNYLNNSAISATSTQAIDAQYYAAVCDLYLYHSNAETRISEFSQKYPQHPKSAQANYDLATFFYNDKKFAKAITFFEKVDKASLNQKELVFYKFKLAYCYLMEKNFEKATLFNDIKNTKGDLMETATYYAGFVNHKVGNYAVAETDIKSLLESKDFVEVVPALYLNILCKQKKYKEALEYVNALDAKEAKYKQSDDVNLLAGEANYQLKDYKNALLRYEKVSNIGKALPDTAFKYGYALYDQEQYAKSVEVLKTITVKNLIGQYAAFYLGLAYLKTDNKQFALAAFTQAAEMNFDSTKIKPKAWYYQGQVNFDLRNFDDAVLVLKRFNNNFPKHELNDEANSLLSEAFLNSNNYQEAIKYIENLPRKTDRTATAYQKVTFYKAMELYNDNKVDLALEFLDKSLENQKNLSFTQKAYYWKGEGLSQLKMHPDAKEAYLAIPSGDELYTIKSYYGLGYTEFQNKKYDEAQKYFQKYIDNYKKDNNKKNYIDALMRAADCKYVEKKYSEAMDGYDKALAANPLSDVDYVLLQEGMINEILENNTEAINNYELLIRRYPNSIYYDNALFQKGNVLFVQNNFESAISVFGTLIKSRPDSKIIPAALLLRGKSYKNVDKVEESVPDFRRIIEEFPSSEVVKNAIQELQESYSRLGKEEEFDKVVEAFDQKNPQHTDLEKIQYQTAFNAYNSKKTDMALVKLKSFMDKFPASSYNADIEYYIGNLYTQKNDTNNAKAYYEKVIDHNKSEFLIDAVSALAKIELNRNNLRKSNELYLRLLKMSISQTEILQAQAGLMDNFYKTQNYDSSIVYAKQVVNSGSKNASLVNRAGIVIGKSYLSKKDTSAAISQFMDMLNTTQDEYGAEANYNAAELFYKTKQHKQSIDKIYFLKEKFKNYKEWYYKSFLLLTDNYLAMNEIFQAKAILKSIIGKSKDKDFVEKAKAKLADIETKYKTEEEEE